MLDPLKDETIVEKVGGRFKLSTLIQKRLVQLHSGSRPLVESGLQAKVMTVLQELGLDKIYLETPLESKADYRGGDLLELDLGDL
jgi:DNA-directed RNA polymerase subunit omega